jgi:hypothetical protein
MSQDKTLEMFRTQFRGKEILQIYITLYYYYYYQRGQLYGHLRKRHYIRVT